MRCSAVRTEHGSSTHALVDVIGDGRQSGGITPTRSSLIYRNSVKTGIWVTWLTSPVDPEPSYSNQTSPAVRGMISGLPVSP